jgi:TonB-dependent receptor
MFLAFFTSYLISQNEPTDVDLNNLQFQNLPSSLLSGISIHLEEATMQLALNEIAKKGAIKLNYNSDIIPLESKVSIQEENINTIEALLIVLKQTSTKLQITKGGSLIILPEDEPKGKIKGVVLDASSGEPLIGADIMIKGTSIGTAANIDGEFVLPAVEPGDYIIKISYVGYKERTEKVTVISNRSTEVSVKLDWVAVEGETVLVTAQARGQLSAINEQLSANEIKNVVSKDRIRELPDANAAESVARLPGVSIVRYGGEGAKVVIRGLSPKYNKIMVDGVQMAATSSGDRSVNMSMISSYSLEGIEVIKSPTANMDANQVGGAVNFKMKTAEKGFNYDIVAQGGYNNLRNSYNNYMFVGSISNRFLGNKFGVFAQANIEQKNLGSNNLGASYYLPVDNIDKMDKVYTGGLSLRNNFRTRKRYGGTFTLDFLIPNGQIYLKNFISSGKTQSDNYSEYFGVTSRDHSYTTNTAQGNLIVYSNILSYSQDFSFFKIDAKLSHSYSESETPKSISFSFLIPSDLKGIPLEVLPEDITDYAQNEISKAYLTNIRDNTSLTQGREIMASLDFTTDFSLSKQINGNIKFGGKYLTSDRSYDYEAYGGVMHLGSGTITKNAILEAFPWMQKTTPLGSSILPYSLFLDHGFDHGEFLKGDYALGSVADVNLMEEVIDVMRGVDEPSPETYNYLDMSSNTYDYSGNEHLSAGYVMANINITDKIKFIPGVRYEYKETSYTGEKGVSASAFPEQKYHHRDTTTVRTNGFFFPMIHLQYKPFKFLQLRAAYAKTISRPNFNRIVPRLDIGKTSVAWNNYKLEPEIAENFDLYLAFSNNYIGFFSVGGFLKNIDNMIFPTPRRVLLDAEEIGLNPIHNGKFIYTQENNKDKAFVKGFELDWQTNFWYLPSFLKGIVLNINYTHITSEAQYPRTIIEQKYVSQPYFHVVKINNDTTYSNRLYNQPDDIVNIAIGYDYKEFAFRLSMLYQSNVFTGPNFSPELRTYTDDYLRWDFTIKQKLPWWGLQVFLNVNDITAEMDRQINYGSQQPTYIQNYGRTVQLGVRWVSQ